MASYDVASTIHQSMDSARHVIKRISNLRCLSSMASYDAARTVHQSLSKGMVKSNGGFGFDKIWLWHERDSVVTGVRVGLKPVLKVLDFSALKPDYIKLSSGVRLWFQQTYFCI
jgi:hypothetical protein